VDLVHETANRAALRSTVDPRTKRDRSSSECGLVDVPMRGTSLWWRGEQVKGTGVPTSVGTRQGGGLVPLAVDEGRQRRSGLNERVPKAWR
jgi:hypothetical protein